MSNHSVLFSSFLMVPLVLAVLLSSLGGCAARVGAGASAETRPFAAPATDGSRAQAPVYPTIDEAVAAAFDSASRRGGAARSAHLQFGTVRRVADGFVFTRPVYSQENVHATSPMRVRLRLERDDVAVYGLHPRSGHADLDRLNESINAHERRLVDERDPLHRPLYVLTPSRRILRHPESTAPIDVVSRAGGRVGGRAGAPDQAPVRR